MDAGILLALLLAGLVHVLATGRTRAQGQVQAATAGPAQAEAVAPAQADRVTAILDNISDGVGVVDADGEFLLHNPAAKHILGLSYDVNGAENWQRHYGMFRADGHTPFPAHDMPLVRALAGEATDHVEMVIRNAAHPDGATISVSGRPLHTPAGQSGAVTVFHDITARTAAAVQLAAATTQLRDELHARIEAEMQLWATRDALAEQKAYLTQVLDAIDVTVITCDTNGTIMHANRTARRAIPVDGADNILDATPKVGLTHIDGSAVAVQDTPLMRALQGENVDGWKPSSGCPTAPTRLCYCMPDR